MTAWRSAALLVLGCALLAPPADAAGRDPVPSSTLFTIEDDEIFESSGLVDTDEVVYTVNDSGSDAVVYGIDPDSGRTVSRTTYADDAEDVEALAPGADGTVWAGDIGDNPQHRDDVTVHRVEPRDGEHPGTPYTLTYPDGAHDAETLLVHPRSGRVFVVSKSVFGGTVYAAPRDLSTGSANRLRPFARVAGLVTDGSFFPDGRHVVLRTYGTATVYTFPGFEPVGTVELPAQRQGEGISVSPSGRVLVSSEGMRAEVLRVDLPAALTAPTASPSGSPSGPAPSTRPPAPATRSGPPPSRSAEDWGWIALVGVVVAAAGYLTVRGSRVRGPRR